MDKLTPLQVVVPSIQTLRSLYGKYFICSNETVESSQVPQKKRARKRARGWGSGKKKKPPAKAVINPIPKLNVSRHLVRPNAPHPFKIRKKIVPPSKPEVAKENTRNVLSNYWAHLKNLKKAQEKEVKKSSECITEKINPDCAKEEEDKKSSECIPEEINLDSAKEEEDKKSSECITEKINPDSAESNTEISAIKNDQSKSNSNDDEVKDTKTPMETKEETKYRGILLKEVQVYLRRIDEDPRYSNLFQIEKCTNNQTEFVLSPAPATNLTVKPIFTRSPRNSNKRLKSKNTSSIKIKKELPVPKIVSVTSLDSKDLPIINSSKEPEESHFPLIDFDLIDDTHQLNQADPLQFETSNQPSLLALLEGLDPSDPKYYEDLSSSETLTLNYLQPELPDSILYKCEHCPKTFTELKFFKLHSRIHETKIRKPYICLHTNCAERFESSMKLQKHRKEAHSRNVETLEVQTAVLQSVPDIPNAVTQSKMIMNEIQPPKPSVDEVKKKKEEEANVEVPNKSFIKDGCIYFYGSGEVNQMETEVPTSNSFESPEVEMEVDSTTFPSTPHEIEEEERSELSIVAVGTVEINRKHRCTLCGEEFDRVFDFLKHERTHSAEANIKSEVFECPYCPRLFSCNTVCKAHIRAHKGGGFAFNARFLYKEEKESSHTRKEIICQHCRMTVSFTTITEYVDHIKAKHPNSSGYQCPYCDRLMKHPWHYRSHVHSHERAYQCKPCGRDFSTKQQLVHHLTTPKHSDRSKRGIIYRKKLAENPNILSNKYTCELCSKAFSSSTNKNRHRKIHLNSFRLHHKMVKEFNSVGQTIPIKKYIYCTRCFKRHSDSIYAKNRCKCNKEFSHKYYVCPICGFKSTSQIKNSAHMRTHKEIFKKFPCKYPECTSAFEHQKDLKQHIKRKHGSKVVAIPDTDLDMKQAEVIQNSLSRRPAFKSTIIYELEPSKLISNGQVQVSRMRKESNQKLDTKRSGKFGCSVCGEEFHGPYQLANHMKSHYLHMCPICREFCKTKKLCQVHIDSHVGEREFDCHICRKPFLNQKALFYHKRSEVHRMNERINSGNPNPKNPQYQQQEEVEEPSIKLEDFSTKADVACPVSDEIVEEVITDVYDEDVHSSGPIQDEVLEPKKEDEDEEQEETGILKPSIQCHLCFEYIEKEEYHQHLLKLHKQNCYDDNNFFRCEPCSMTFLSYDHWKEHLSDESHFQVIQFLISQEETSTDVSHLPIAITVTNNHDHLDQISINNVDDDIELIEAIQEEFMCSQCNFTFPDKETLEEHLLEHLYGFNATDNTENLSRFLQEEMDDSNSENLNDSQNSTETKAKGISESTKNSLRELLAERKNRPPPPRPITNPPSSVFIPNEPTRASTSEDILPSEYPQFVSPYIATLLKKQYEVLKSEEQTNSPLSTLSIQDSGTEEGEEIAILGLNEGEAYPEEEDDEPSFQIVNYFSC